MHPAALGITEREEKGEPPGTPRPFGGSRHRSSEAWRGCWGSASPSLASCPSKAPSANWGMLGESHGTALLPRLAFLIEMRSDLAQREALKIAFQLPASKAGLCVCECAFLLSSPFFPLNQTRCLSHEMRLHELTLERDNAERCEAPIEPHCTAALAEATSAALAGDGAGGWWH